MKISLILILSVLWFASCKPDENRAQPNRYFDVEAFVKEQINRLDSLRPTVEKTVASGEQQETRQLSAINWTKELDLFIQADLNKPAYRNSYLIEKPTARSIIYRAKPGEDVPVKYLRVEVDSLQGRLQNVEATMANKNYLYQSEKKLVLHCVSNAQGQWLVRDYRVSGFQRLAFFDKKPFEVSGKIL